RTSQNQGFCGGMLASSLVRVPQAYLEVRVRAIAEQLVVGDLQPDQRLIVRVGSAGLDRGPGRQCSTDARGIDIAWILRIRGQNILRAQRPVRRRAEPAVGRRPDPESL